MGTKLYVGNLNETAKGADLQELFNPFGTVKWADVATDPASGRCRGFGFVMMSSEEDARRAVAGLHGRGHEGKLLKVSEAKPRGAASKTRQAPPPRVRRQPRRQFRPKQPGR